MKDPHIQCMFYMRRFFFGLVYKPIVYRMIRTLKAMDVFELNLFEFKSHLNSEML